MNTVLLVSTPRPPGLDSFYLGTDAGLLLQVDPLELGAPDQLSTANLVFLGTEAGN